MCGICGIIKFDGAPVEPASIKKMMTAIKHRGPDDEGIFIEKNIGFGHVRLSIIDLSSAGRQPMLSDDGNLVIVYNGEIYNYIELREQLAGKYNFRTRTDTEVILSAYMEWGRDCLDKLNGMFAFAIYNKKNCELFMARDRFGIKPFYYYHDGFQFIFGSDIPAILAVIPKQREPNNQAIYDFLFFNRTNHNETTFFKNIKKLQHGHCISIMGTTVSGERWYDLSRNIDNGCIDADEFREMFKSSINFQLRSDVPLGVCLSGGLDSSSILSMILRYFDRPDIHTFSAVYEKGDHGDESSFISEFQADVPNMHFTKPTADSLYTDIEHFVEALVEPVPGTSEYAEFKVMQLAKNHVTVLLNGQGADESMAGYLYFAGFYYKELFRKMKLMTLSRELACDIKNHKSLEGLLGFIYFSLPLFLKNRFNINKVSYMHKEFSHNYKGSNDIVATLYGSKSLRESFINHFEHKFEHHLIWADRSAMWFSLESRFPFLDHRFVEKILSIESKKCIYRGWNKYILRDAMRGILPEKIRLRRDKVGYATPEDDWFRGNKLKQLVYDILHSETCAGRGYIDNAIALKLFEKHLDGTVNIAADIWKWIHLELWFRKFID